MHRLRGWFAPLLFLATALAGGPGLAGLEAYEHAHRTTPGHGYRIHFERRGGADHDDACRIWLIPAPARTPTPPQRAIRPPSSIAAAPQVAVATLYSADPTLLPHSRAPPLAV
ncbi:MAG TPA: hypothetical protein VGQ17_17135 [Gemmatimonadales bacterium]|jgi:hypothetical protein|nr:hypothetical protein [Gemmatimonadales bacterium]